MSISFDDMFFKAAGFKPFAYQRRLACNLDTDDEASSGVGTTCQSQLIEIPTGLGKTAAVVLAWLWNRVLQPDIDARQAWPRRLTYCLPIRTLVEQTRDNVKQWLENLAKAFPSEEMQWLAKNSPIVLMGGENNSDWDIHPEKNAILIGTQDMLLSRALNRGYGLARARWPMHFGLLNNDCVWVLDETQLMGVGVRTSAQMEGFRAKLGTVIGCATWWTSATLDPRPLKTPDHRALPQTLSLTDDDLRNEEVQRRVAAVKRLAPLPLTLTSESAKVAEPYLDQLALAVLERHQPRTITIVIVNRVTRAQELFATLEKMGKKQLVPPLILVHSRFRPMERAALSPQVKDGGEKIIIATQAIEAGVDISARTLLTELAPWSSLVQRFGRCNRKGEFNETGGADIFWINLEAEDEKTATNLALPYTPEQFVTARALLREAAPTGAGPASLGAIKAEEPLPEAHILRRKDLVDLFDTTPDLAGLDIDVGRYIRDGEERDVQVYWRELPTNAEPPEEIVALRRELVRVSLSAFKKFASNEKNKSGIWLWNVLDGEWQRLRPDRIAPGQVYLVDAALGGYSVTRGWTGEKSKDPFPILTLEDQSKDIPPRDGQDRDDESQLSRDKWQSIETHTERVVAACREKLASFPNAAPWTDALLLAARWHDVGKAHASFQTFITGGRIVPPEFAGMLIAKSPWKQGSRHQRPHFRHELASTLAWLQAGGVSDPTLENLVAYLIATHHGKIRLSLRAMPGEIAPASPIDSLDENALLYARGVWQGDKLPSDETKRLTIEGYPTKPIILDLSCMQMGEQEGRPSWTARVLSLRDSSQLGLFRLAWLEAFLRSADAEGSQK